MPSVAGGEGQEVCRALTAELDGGIRALAGDLGPGVALVAVGGYGRGELSPYSDVDLMVLHDLTDPSEVAAAVFRPLWDAGLRVGHSVRTVDEATHSARERFDTFTTLLTGRWLAGDVDLFRRMEAGVAAVTRARPLRRYLVSEELERRRRSPYLEMAVDVKNGRGGLRTLHGFEWERRREQLIGRFTGRVGADASSARQTLVAIRNALHAVAGRAYDIYAFDLREAVARWLQSDVPTVSRRLVEAMTVVDRLADQRWPELVGKPVRRRVMGAASKTDTGVLDAHQLARILRSGEQGRREFENLREAGALTDVLPVWERVRTLPHLVPFHAHPVAHHLWRTVDEMQALAEGHDHYGRIASQVDAPDVLTLAAFLHDIGKGSGADHSETGAAIAHTVCVRLGCAPGVTRTVAAAVRHHLLMAEAATRRDLDDPAVVEEVVDALGDVPTLRVVYLLTVADSRATGDRMWSQWKATLLRRLFERCLERLSSQGPRPSLQQVRAQLLDSVGAGRRAVAESHLAGMPDAYVWSVTGDDLARHLELLDRRAGPVITDIGVDAASDILVVAGPGWKRLRVTAAECLAANGIDVLEARLHTRADGLVLDTFHVRDERTGGRVEERRWTRFRRDLEAALTGETPATSKMVARAAAYPAPGPARAGFSVRARQDPSTGELVISISCPDRVGRLAQILGVLGDLNLEIRLAKVDSRGGEVVDTFHLAARQLEPGHRLEPGEVEALVGARLGGDDQGGGGRVLSVSRNHL